MDALHQLQNLDKRFSKRTHHSSESGPGWTDKLYHQLVSTLWTPEPTESKEEIDAIKQTEYRKITSLLEESAKTYNNNDALLLLAELNFFSKYGYHRNYKNAFTYYDQLASKGNATAQQMIGFIYATGVGNITKRDQAKALLYHTFAAYGGDTAAEMTLGYRYLLGIGTEEKCEDALYYYKAVAKKVIDYYLSGPPGGHTPPLAKVRLSDENGGVYGYSASMVTERKRRGGYGGGTEKSVSIDEILQYWRYLAQNKHDVDAQLMLGQVYYLGTRSVARNFEEAHNFFYQIVEKGTSGGKISTKNSKPIGQAAGYLGMMYWRGEGVPVSPQAAHKWFSIGVKLQDPIAQNGLGMMYLKGVVVPMNHNKAIEYFKKAADQDNANAQVNLAIEYLQSEANLPLAVRLFTKAADSKHLLAYWYLAQMNDQGVTSRPSCRVAVSYYKAITERGDWLHSTTEDGYDAYMNGDKEGALLYYKLAAERGYEIAQSNVAYMLDTDKQILSTLPFFGSEHKEPKDNEAEQSALIYWSRSANQNNVDSRIKMGDYYYKGIGTPVDYEKAVACYRTAAELQMSPMAMWNLGWMYENGIGVSKDFHLAKRSYDHALNINQDAYLPVKLSLMNMYIKYYWQWITGKEVGESLQIDNHDKRDHPFKADKVKNSNEMQDRKSGWEDADEEMKRQYYKKKQMEREENDHFAEETKDSSYEYEYNEEDELFESVLILALCMFVGWLVYVRQYRMNNQPRNNNNANIANNNHG
ncbi:hypothetical protein BDB01DRAFT_716782 [Pilobolus umbonatus]|nr:hypothetical protein BDB01DRAFT_716782 [Pilobolus umbonatus]